MANSSRESHTGSEYPLSSMVKLVSDRESHTGSEYPLSSMVKLVSDREADIYLLVNYVIIAGAISLFGVVANVMNIMVFCKQGFNSTINISFSGLAVSDLCALLTLLWFCVCVNPLLIQSDVPMIFAEVRYLTGGLPHACFARITGWITVFMTAERCLCITIPLRIKQVITPKRTTVIVCIIYLVMISSFLPEYATAYLEVKFNSERNKTMLGLSFTSNRKSMEGLVFFLYFFLGSASFIAVIVFTVVLVVKLKEKSKWRRKANVDTARSETISVRDRKTMNMVAMIATVLIVCYTPGAAVSMVTFFESDISPVGINVNAFFVLWSFALIFQAINSSVNIFLYYSMSTKYRETFGQLFITWNSK